MPFSRYEASSILDANPNGVEFGDQRNTFGLMEYGHISMGFDATMQELNELGSSMMRPLPDGACPLVLRPKIVHPHQIRSVARMPCLHTERLQVCERCAAGLVEQYQYSILTFPSYIQYTPARPLCLETTNEQIPWQGQGGPCGVRRCDT